MKLENILNRLTKMAKDSKVSQKHSAVILYKGVPVSFAINTFEEHAEAVAIKNYLRLAVRKGWRQKCGLFEPQKE